MIIKESYSIQIYDILKDQIINNLRPPGSKIKIEEIEKEYEISKTPLKEALNKLKYEGYVTVKPRSGTYVAEPSTEEIIQVYDLRQAIEWKAIQLAVPNIPTAELLKLKKDVLYAEEKIQEGEYSYFFDTDIRLHKMIIDYANNKYIENVKDTIDGHIQWFRILGATKKSRPHKSSVRHQEIIEAILERDIEKSAELIKIHLEEVQVAVAEDVIFE